MTKVTKINLIKELIKKYHKFLVLEMINELKVKGCDQRLLIEKYKTKLPLGMAKDLKEIEKDIENNQVKKV